tara:strand:+ start:9702 stop:11426 length:1725 start_codon:yes stop_codon:yes gene_type:complete
MNIKKGILGISVIFLLIICSSFSLAALQEVFSGDIGYQDTIDAGGINFTAASYGIPPTKGVIRYLDNTVIVEEGDCSRTDTLTICVNGFSDGDYDYEKQKQTFKVDVTISQNVAAVDIIREISERSLDLGEVATITTKLQNNQDKDVTDISFRDEFPSQITLSNVKSPCVQKGNAATLEKDIIDSGDEVTCKYDVKIEAPVDEKIKAKVTYDNGISMVEKESESITFRVENEFFNVHITQSKVPNLNEDIKAYINISNVKDSSLTIENLKITIPEQFKLLRLDAALKEDLTWTGTIGKNKTRTFVLDLQAQKTGKDALSVLINLNYNGVNLDLDNKQDLEVKKPEIDVFSPFTEFQFNSGEDLRIYFNLTNPTKIGFKNVAYSISSNLPDIPEKSESELELPTKTSMRIYDETITLPDVTETYDLEIKVAYNYETYGGEKLTGEYTEYLFILPSDAEKPKTVKKEVEKDDKKEEVSEGSGETETQSESSSEDNEIEKIGSFDKGGASASLIDKAIPYIMIIILVLLVLFLTLMFVFMRKGKKVKRSESKSDSKDSPKKEIGDSDMHLDIGDKKE